MLQGVPGPFSCSDVDSCTGPMWSTLLSSALGDSWYFWVGKHTVWILDDILTQNSASLFYSLSLTLSLSPFLSFFFSPPSFPHTFPQRPSRRRMRDRTTTTWDLGLLWLQSEISWRPGETHGAFDFDKRPRPRE